MNIKRLLFSGLILSLLFVPTSAMRAAELRSITYVVNSNTDLGDASPGDHICATSGGNCTLRAAIMESNADGQYSIIKFASKFQGSNTIGSCNLEITAPNTFIDASERWDTTHDRPGVEIVSSSCTTGLIKINANNNTIKGLFFGGGSSVGINIWGGSGNTIGGYGQGERNVFLTSKYGVWLQAGMGEANSVVNNYFGTVDSESIPGMVAGDSGLFLVSEGNTIEDNLIVGYSDAGINLFYSDDNVISNNIIGMSKWKDKALGNEVGIFVTGDSNNIGPDNVIGGNKSHGIELYQANDTTITGNLIGYPYSINGIGNGGDGVHLHAAYNTIINGLNLIGYNAGNGVWLDFDDVTIQGNGISYNGKAGIHITGGANSLIGGSTSQARNVISDNQGSGIQLTNASNVTISGNYIGLDGAGAFDHGNQGYGILVENGTKDSQIGGIGAGSGNLIAYNDTGGIRILGATTHNNQVLGNILGAPIHWAWEAGNGNHGIGIYDGAHDNRVGSLTPGAGNIILDSGWSAVVIKDSSLNIIEGNQIGTDGGSINWGNAYFGVHIVGSGSGNDIIANEIAYNGTHNGQDGVQAGVEVNGSLANKISQNSIHDNDGPGIRLINNGNNMFPAPQITNASCRGPISGTSGAPEWFIEIFSDSEDEGRIYEGVVQADASGAWTWNGQPSGPNLTATARGPYKDTSVFSAPFNIGSCNSSPTASFTVQLTSGTPTTIFTFDASGSSDHEDPTSALEVRWDWENDGIYDTQWSSNKIATHQFSEFGVHTVRLMVRDTGGLTAQATRQVSVGGQPSQNNIYLPLIMR